MKYNQPYGVSDPNAPYINGNPSTGTMGSIPPAASIEYPQREIVNFISDSRLTPDNADLHQIGKSVQSNGVVYCDDQGTLNQLVITVAPAPTALIKGMVFIVKSAISNTGPTTLKVNALAPVPVVRATVTSRRCELGDIAPNALLAYRLRRHEFSDGLVAAATGCADLSGRATGLLRQRHNRERRLSMDRRRWLADGHGPYKTIQARVPARSALYNMNGFSITINVADGTYNEGVSVPRQNGAGFVQLNGNVTNPANCHVHATNTSAFRVLRRSPLTFQRLQGFLRWAACARSGKWQASHSVLAARSLSSSGAMEFGTCTGPRMYVTIGASMAGELATALQRGRSAAAQVSL